MSEPNRRHPKRPVLFWAVFAVVAVVSLGAAGGLWLRSETWRPPVLHGP